MTEHDAIDWRACIQPDDQGDHAPYIAAVVAALHNAGIWVHTWHCYDSGPTQPRTAEVILWAAHTPPWEGPIHLVWTEEHGWGYGPEQRHTSTELAYTRHRHQRAPRAARGRRAGATHRPGRRPRHRRLPRVLPRRRRPRRLRRPTAAVVAAMSAPHLTAHNAQ